MAVPMADQFDAEVPVIEAIRSGDRYAFAELVHRHTRWVRSVVFAVLGRREVVDDVVQQVWATVWRRMSELRDSTRWRPWLYRLARNAAIDAGREVRRRRGEVEAAASALVDRWGSSAGPADAERTEQKKMVLDAVKSLPALYREPFVLRHLNDWTYRQIADVMDLPVDTVETRLVRARRLLRELLEGKV